MRLFNESVNQVKPEQLSVGPRQPENRVGVDFPEVRVIVVMHKPFGTGRPNVNRNGCSRQDSNSTPFSRWRISIACKVAVAALRQPRPRPAVGTKGRSTGEGVHPGFCRVSMRR
jgi:hypothetical protein